MRKIIECVPNFSEGNNRETIDAIAQAIKETPGCTLLDVDPGKVNQPDRILPLSVIRMRSSRVPSTAPRVARERIDMRMRTRENIPAWAPWMSARSYPWPTSPWTNAWRSRKPSPDLAAEALGVPFFLYEAAADSTITVETLPQVRQGEYEGLGQRV
jgi:glutamate formiminotransferase/formiminotetrahydrofolate cyclodeaminase